MAQEYKDGKIRIQATLTGGMKARFKAYGKIHDMKESEVIKEGLRQLFKKD